jgi:hypothetical protein
VRSTLGFQAKRELLLQVAPRYREMSGKEKSAILNEFVAATGYDRKYAIRLLSKPVQAITKKISRPRKREYGPEVQQALVVAWTAANCICAKRLIPFLPNFVPTLETHGHLTISDEVRRQLLSMSPATADRILTELRPRERRGATMTKRGSLLKHQIPVRTFADWDDARPGFFEVDTVAHCGANVEGIFLWSLVLTDISTGWTECLALRHRSGAAVNTALDVVRELLPFTLLGLDSDNGVEFINNEVLDYCCRSGITFTRGRVHKKNDQCFVEQKNGSIVRQIVGYDRYAGEVAYRQLSELYRAVRLYVNFFQPSMKLVAKKRDGSKVQRRYDTARTPFQRLTASEALAEEKINLLTEVFHALDPVRLLQQIRALQDALWRHALDESKTSTERSDPKRVTQPVPFDPAICFLDDEAPASDNETSLSSTVDRATEVKKRKYRRTKKTLGPRTYRTRADAFEPVSTQLHQWYLDAPERTAKSLLQELQIHYPGQYPDNLLRTLQRRVRTWRRQMILEFDDHRVSEKNLLDEGLPTSLRATPIEMLPGG